MKIIFLCGSLEPGKDGVGDYTRRLAGELIKQGHSASIIALYDRFVSTLKYELQNSEGINFEVLRIPYSYSSRQKILEAKKRINQLTPDWLSLQFVPFAFHKKGLPFGVVKELVKLGTARRWHIMFHELWVGMGKKTSLKLKIWGRVQKYLLINLIKNLQPKVLHTQSQVYLAELKNIGVTALHLPLFGNIIPTRNSSNRIAEFIHLKQKGIHLVLFGSIHPNAPVKDFANYLRRLNIDKQILITVTFVGRNGKELNYWKACFEKNEVMVKVLGEQEEEAISYILSNSTAGISSTPFPLIEKSGSVAAMLEHGLPVVCVSQRWEGIKVHFDLSKEIHDFTKDNLESLLTKRPVVRVNASSIAQALAKSLGE